MTGSEYHDAQILSVAYDPSSGELALVLRLDGGSSRSLRFRSVLGWNFSPFEMQNILFQINIYDRDNLPDGIAGPEDAHLVQAVRTGRYKLIELDASAGMGGMIAAAEVVVNR